MDYSTNDFVVNGAIAGLVVVGAVGIVLALRGHQIRDFAASHIGDAGAKWVLAAVWFAYAYSAINAVGQTLTIIPTFQPDVELPTAVAFVYGSIWYPLLSFLNSLVPLIHTAVFVAVAVVIFRRTRQVAP